MNKCFRDEICKILKAAATAECQVGGLCELERRVQRVFGKRLRYGTAFAPVPGNECKADILHTVMTVDRLNEDCALSSISVTAFTGGVLTSSPLNPQNIRCVYSGVGKAFKFMRHSSDQDHLLAEHFVSDGFLYECKDLALLPSAQGTIACVNADAKPAFIASSLCMVSDSRIDDIRLYTDRGRMIYDLLTLYEEIISSDLLERDKVFHYLL